MTISKRTVDETLETYLEEKGIDSDNVKKIKKQLHKNIKNPEIIDDIITTRLTRVSHGTSCPRISNKYGELIVEM